MDIIGRQGGRLLLISDVPFSVLKQFAHLANDVYNPSPNGTTEWIPVPQNELQAMGLGQAAFENGSFRSQLYKCVVGNAPKYALAFRGTRMNSAGNWWANLPQGLLGTLAPHNEYDDAVNISDLVSRAVGNASLTMVGHSLGGGLADAAALFTNRPAVTFNAAGLNILTEIDNGYESYSKTLTNYSVDGEALTTLQKTMVMMPGVSANNYTLKPIQSDGHNPIKLHSMDSVLHALGF